MSRGYPNASEINAKKVISVGGGGGGGGGGEGLAEFQCLREWV